MNSKVLMFCGLVCWIALLIQQSDGFFFYTAGTAGATAAGTGVTAATANTLLLGGLVVAKVAGLGILALLLARRNSNRGRSYGRRYRGRYRGKREAGFSGDEDIAEIDENDIAAIKYESEAVFRQLEATDPAHCFRRFICDLSTGMQQNVTTDQLAILNLVAQPFTEKSFGFEYGIASSLGKTFGRIDVCEASYNCPLTGQQIGQLLN